MNITEKLKAHFFELCLVALLIKTMIAGSTLADALVLISLVVSVCYAKHYLVKQKADLTEDQSKLIKDMEAKVNHLTLGQSFKRGANDFTKK